MTNTMKKRLGKQTCRKFLRIRQQTLRKIMRQAQTVSIFKHPLLALKLNWTVTLGFTDSDLRLVQAPTQ